MDWINLAKYREKWQAVVNTVTTTGFHIIWDIYWLTEEVPSCQGGLWSLLSISHSVSQMILFEHFLQYNNVLCYRNKEILVSMGKLSGMNATTDEYESAYNSVQSDTLQSYGIQVCSLEEQLDQVRQLYILCCWGKALDSFWRFWFDPQSQLCQLFLVTDRDTVIHTAEPKFKSSDNGICNNL